MKKISIVLPFSPISTNSMYICARGRIILSKAARTFKRDVAEYLRRLGAKRIKGDVSLKFVFMWRDRRRRDLDNYLKVSTDALKEILFGDDSKIQFITARKILGGPSTCIGICVAPYTDPSLADRRPPSAPL